MAKVLYNVRWTGERPTLEAICQRFGFTTDELDQQYGVIEIDPDEHVYSILVEDSAVARVGAEWRTEGTPLEGPFSNPRIEPFGPPEC
jgi:hypothetical protein